jgi:hypothetical protein
MMHKAVLITMLLLLGAACTTPYQSDGWTGGYKDEKLGDNQWRVSFLGNANRDAAFTWNAAMYRAAEIAQREGYRYFQVTFPSTEVFSRAYVNFTNLVSYRSELTMSGLQTEAGCPQGRGRACQVYGTPESLRDYGNLIGASPKR